MTAFGLFSQTFNPDNRTWLADDHGTEIMPGVALDLTAFTAGQHYPNGFIPSGTVLGKITASGKYGPYSGTTDEVQTVTEGGSGLTSFTLTLSGQTTGSIAAAATAATVQAALEALSNIGAGNVLVTGSNGGPYTVTFRGALADTDVAQMTATPTGGSGTVTVATVTAGGADASADGRQAAVGIMFNPVPVYQPGTATLLTNVGVPILIHGFVIAANLPFNATNAPAGGFLDANGQADLKNIVFVPAVA